MKKRFFKSVKYFLIIVVTLYISAFAQNEQFQGQREIPRDSLLIFARTIIDSARCRVLVTVDETGKPHAREMAPFDLEDDWTIWLGTFPTSRKVKQIQKNPNVVVFYYDTKGMSYVSVSGKASLVNDPTLKAKYWVESWKRYYPDRDKHYILIKVIPERIELCSYRYHLFWGLDGTPFSIEFNSDLK